VSHPREQIAFPPCSCPFPGWCARGPHTNRTGRSSKVMRSGRSALWLPRVGCLQRCRVCACAALTLCAVCVHWGHPPAELRAGVRWAKLAWRFGCVGAVRRRRPAVLHCWRRRLGAGGRERGGEGGLTRVYPPGCYLFRRDGMSRQLFFELRTASFSTIARRACAFVNYEACSAQRWRISTAGTAADAKAHTAVCDPQQSRYLSREIRRFICFTAEDEYGSSAKDEYGDRGHRKGQLAARAS
jgi:hypothetical protein